MRAGTRAPRGLQGALAAVLQGSAADAMLNPLHASIKESTSENSNCTLKLE
jgi:hypothetical protein